MAKDGKILEQDIIEDAAYQIGTKFGKSLEPANKAIKEFEKNFMDSMAAIKKVAIDESKLSVQYKEVGGRKEFLATKKQEIQLSEQTIVAYKEQDRAEKNLIASIERKKIATESTNRALIKERFELQQQNKAVKEAAILSSKLATEYQKLQVKYNQSAATVQSLNAKRLQGIQLSKAEQTQLKKSTADFQRYQKAILGADESIGRFNRNVGNYPKAMLAAGNAMRTVFSALGYTGGVYAAITVMKEAFNTIKEFNSGLLDVSKTAGISGKDLRLFGDDVIKLSNKLENVSTKSLLEYATVAGQLGVKGSANILAFSESLAKLETASDVAGEEGGAKIARLLKLVDGGVKNIKQFGDELVKLGNNFAASESEILGNATAIAQNTGVYKLARQETLAYAVATKAAGIEAEITGSTIGKTLGILEKSIRTTKGLEDISRLTGIAQNELGKAFRENSGDVLQKLIKGLNDVSNSGGSVNAELEKLGIIAIRDQRVIGTLATSGYDTLARSMRDVADAAGSLDEEFKTAQGKIENQLKRISTSWDNFVLNIEDGQGVLGTVIKGFSDKMVDELDKANLRLNENIGYWDSWKLRVNGAIGNMSFGMIKPFEESTKVLIAHTKAINDDSVALAAQTSEYIKQYGSIGPLTEAQKELTVATHDYFSLMDDSTYQPRSIIDIRNEIKNLNEEIEKSDALDKAGIKSKQDAVNALQKELDAILGVTRATKKMNDAAVGSVAYMEMQVALLKNKQSHLAKTSKEYFDQEKKIRKAQLAVKDFKDEVLLLMTELDGVNAGLNIVGNTEQSFTQLSQIINSTDFGKIKGLDYDRALSDLADFSDKFVNDEAARLERIGELNREFAERQKQLQSDLADASLDFVNNVFDAKSQRYQDDIDENNAYYEALFNNEELSDNQRAALEAERDKKNLALEKKKREEQKKAEIINRTAAVAQIAIKTAQTIAAINLAAAELNAISFGTAGTAYAAIQIPMAIALGAAQSAAILAAPMPKYAQGKGQYDNYEGPAIWGEKRREIKISKDGSIELSPKKIGNHLTHVKKDDIIHPDANKFMVDYQRLIRASILASVEIDNNKLKTHNADHSFMAYDERLLKQMQLNTKAIEQNKTKIILPKQSSIDFEHELFRAKKTNWDL